LQETSCDGSRSFLHVAVKVLPAAVRAAAAARAVLRAARSS